MSADVRSVGQWFIALVLKNALSAGVFFCARLLCWVGRISGSPILGSIGHCWELAFRGAGVGGMLYRACVTYEDTSIWS